MNKIHNFIGEQIIKYIFRHGGMITVRRKAGAVQVAKVYSKAAYENVIVPALNLYTHRNIKTNADRIRSMSDDELTDIILCPYDTAGKPANIMTCVRDGNIQELVFPEYCKKCMMDWLQSEVEE